MNNFIDEYSLISGTILFLLGAFLCSREGKKLVDNYLDEDYVLMSFSIKKFGAGLVFLTASVFLLNKELRIF
jgi:hypothetical protein